MTNLNTRDEHGRTSLHLAAQYGTPETVLMLLDIGENIETRDRDGNTPLHTAAQYGTPETVLVLLDAGADPKVRNGDGMTPADLADDNPSLRNHDIFWTLNQARYE